MSEYILIVHDDGRVRKGLDAALEREGFKDGGRVGEYVCDARRVFMLQYYSDAIEVVRNNGVPKAAFIDNSLGLDSGSKLAFEILTWRTGVTTIVGSISRSYADMRNGIATRLIQAGSAHLGSAVFDCAPFSERNGERKFDVQKIVDTMDRIFAGTFQPSAAPKTPCRPDHVSFRSLCSQMFAKRHI